MPEDTNDVKKTALSQRKLPVRAAELSVEVARILTTINELVIAFAGKRTTLEEEAICRYFNSLAAVYAQILAALHAQSAKGNADSLSPAVDTELSHVNSNVSSILDDLCRAIAFSFNYVEQYFEYDFYARLQEEYKLVEQAEKVLHLLNTEVV